MGESPRDTSCSSFLLPLLGEFSLSYSALPAQKIQRSDRRRDYTSVYPLGEQCCAEWCYSQAPLYVPMMRNVAVRTSRECEKHASQ